MTIFELLLQIKNTKGINDKQEIIARNLDSEELLITLRYLNIPSIKSNIGKKKVSKALELVGEFERIENYKAFISYLSGKSTGKDLDIQAVQYYISLNEPYKELLEDIATKKLSLGIKAKGINKVLVKYNKKLIYTHEVMKAESYSLVQPDLTDENIYLTNKLDGVRGTFIYDSDKNALLSRSGLEFNGLNHIIEHAVNLPDNMVFDGELISKNPDNLSSEDLFNLTKGLLNSNNSKEDIVFHIFDMLTLDEYYKGYSNKVYSERRNDLNTIEENEFIKVVPIHKHYPNGATEEEILTELAYLESQGEEGCMINIANKPYLNKRTKNILKVKSFHSCDGVIVDLIEGQGRLKSTLGKVAITFEDIVVNIGSGMTDEERDYFWNNKDEIIGKVAEYSYFQKSKNNRGEMDLRFATWKGLRPDKEPSDVFYE